MQISDNSEDNNGGRNCGKLEDIAKKYYTLFNYVCYSKANSKDLDPTGDNHTNKLFFVVNSVAKGVWLP